MTNSYTGVGRLLLSCKNYLLGENPLEELIEAGEELDKREDSVKLLKQPRRNKKT